MGWRVGRGHRELAVGSGSRGRLGVTKHGILHASFSKDGVSALHAGVGVQGFAFKGY